MFYDNRNMNVKEKLNQRTYKASSKFILTMKGLYWHQNKEKYQPNVIQTVKPQANFHSKLIFWQKPQNNIL